jgi:hypothetical protein
LSSPQGLVNILYDPGVHQELKVAILQVPDCQSKEYWQRMDRLLELNGQLQAIAKSDAPAVLKKLQQAPVVERMAANVLQLFLQPPLEQGSVDVNEPAMAY